MAILQARVSNCEEELIKQLAKRENVSVSELLRKSVLSRATADSRLLLYGSLHGKITISCDFDAPLEEFAEYM